MQTNICSDAQYKIHIVNRWYGVFVFFFAFFVCLNWTIICWVLVDPAQYQRSTFFSTWKGSILLKMLVHHDYNVHRIAKINGDSTLDTKTHTHTILFPNIIQNYIDSVFSNYKWAKTIHKSISILIAILQGFCFVKKGACDWVHHRSFGL